MSERLVPDDNDGLNDIVASLEAHQARKTRGDLGKRIEWQCPKCNRTSWSYEGYLTAGSTLDDALSFLAARHTCPITDDDDEPDDEDKWWQAIR